MNESSWSLKDENTRSFDTSAGAFLFHSRANQRSLWIGRRAELGSVSMLVLWRAERPALLRSAI